MLLMIITHLFRQKPIITEDFSRLMKTEYRTIPPEFVEYFIKENKRLPTLEELDHAV